ncbi:MAG: hypothetical protein IT162_14045 [Bryobacterales bacterium]|nr:hypothetical protein [Bryobacterales bacterium]
MVPNDGFVFVDAGGRVDTLAAKSQLEFGAALRIRECYHHPTAWILAYCWFGDTHPRGLLRVDPGEGITGRWEEIIA